MSIVPSSRRLLSVATIGRWVRGFSDMPPTSYLGRVRDKTKHALDQTESVVRSLCTESYRVEFHKISQPNKTVQTRQTSQ